MITLNDYLYSGDTILRILHNYIHDLRAEAKKTHNEVDMIHCNFLILIRELLEHNDSLLHSLSRSGNFINICPGNILFLHLHLKDESNP